ncbi:hypothetical protein GCM10009848_04900 [Micromonospora lupini]
MDFRKAEQGPPRRGSCSTLAQTIEQGRVVEIPRSSSSLNTGDPFERLVLRYRDEPSPVLKVELALMRLLDTRGCDALAQDLREMAKPWEVYTAASSLKDVLPEDPGLYMFVWRPPFKFELDSGSSRPGSIAQVLYVGQAGATAQNPSGNTLRGRFREYTRYLDAPPEGIWQDDVAARRASVLSRCLSLRPLEYWCAVVPNRTQIALLEDRLIKLLNPPANLNRGPRLRAQPPVPAFSRNTSDRRS